MGKSGTIWKMLVVILSFLFLSGSFLRAAETSDVEYQEWLKEKRMKQEKSMESSEKSPFLGSLMAAAIPTTGHLYANDWTRGLKYFAGEVVGIGLMAWGVVSLFSKDSTLYFGFVTFLTFKIWEIVDAYGAVKDYNIWHRDSQKGKIDLKIVSDVRRYGYSGYINPDSAFLLSLIIPTAGQWYTDSWATPEMIILGGELLGLGMTFGHFWGGSDIGLPIFITFKIWDVWDAHNAATNYNHTLYKDYKTKLNKSNVGLYMPNTNTFGLQWSYHF